jgi:hypothetical protein
MQLGFCSGVGLLGICLGVYGENKYVVAYIKDVFGDERNSSLADGRRHRWSFVQANQAAYPCPPCAFSCRGDLWDLSGGKTY